MCVNSVIHRFGVQPYAPDEVPSENILVTILALGEGWHNFHHFAPYDYATSEYSIFQEWNPSKLIIDCLYLMGQVSNRKRAKRETIKKVKEKVIQKEEKQKEEKQKEEKQQQQKLKQQKQKQEKQLEDLLQKLKIN